MEYKQTEQFVRDFMNLHVHPTATYQPDFKGLARRLWKRGTATCDCCDNPMQHTDDCPFYEAWEIFATQPDFKDQAQLNEIHARLSTLYATTPFCVNHECHWCEVGEYGELPHDADCPWNAPSDIEWLLGEVERLEKL